MFTTTSMTGQAMPLVGAAFLLADALALFAPVLGMVAGIGANHERLKLRIAALEQRVAQAEWRDGVKRGGAAKVTFRNWFPEGAFACTMISLWEGARA